MEWFIWTPIAIMALLCPLMMVGMMVGGWLFARGRGGHASHGMMMCHGGHGDEGDHPSTVDTLKAERERLDALITRAERDMDGRPA